MNCVRYIPTQVSETKVGISGMPVTPVRAPDGLTFLSTLITSDMKF